MGRQVNFILHPDDQADFDRFLTSFEDVVLVPEIQRREQLTIVPDTLTSTRDVAVEGSRIYLVRPPDVAAIEQRTSSPEHGYWLIDDRPLPVVHFDRSVLHNDRISIGRLYFEPAFVRDGAWVNKPEAAVRWADKLLRGARRRLQKVELPLLGGTPESYLMGPAAIAWRERHQATLRSGYVALIAAAATE